MDIRAAVLRQSPAPAPYAASRALSVETLTLAPPGDGEVLVEIKAAGLCHSDLSVINGDRPRPMPMVLGHEASGVVREVGRGVRSLARGDHVVLVFVPSCGHCACCAEGRPALCEPGNAANVRGEMLEGGRRLSLGGAPVNHHLGVSAFASHAVVSEHSAVKVDPALPFDLAAVFGCAVLTGVGAVVNTAGVKAGQTVAVVGLGGVGLSAVLGAAAAGAGRIVAVDIAEDKLAFARTLGATDTVNAGDAAAVEAMRAELGGVDYALEMAGSVRALETAVLMTKRGGATITAGLANATHTFALSPSRLVVEERVLRGSYVGGCIPKRDIPRYIALHQRGKLPVDRLMTSRGTLDDINEGFDRLAQGQTIRHIIMM
ncbi:MAG: alcohol dehydrogenase catalytic domain-containing protein [Proteobacteria bacterium]|nr:alcohol dehydrogenase catalytic domain-containing protein [Pseudomonadota bacterium]